MTLLDRRVLITGGGSGIGLALARALVSAREPSGDRGQRRRKARGRGVPRLESVELDDTSEHDSRREIAWVEEHLGGWAVAGQGAKPNAVPERIVSARWSFDAGG